MTEFVLSHEPTIRLSFFLGILAVMAAWEILAPRRALTLAKSTRRANNLGIVFLNSLLLRLIFPAGAVGVALFAGNRGWGLFNHFETPYFGFNLSLWDRFFGTYQDQLEHGHEKMTLGVRCFRDPKQADRLPGMLMLPFIGKVMGYAINRREWKSPK